MATPVALQLYSVREAIGERGFEEVIRKVAQMGYAGVEPAGFPGTTPEEARKLFDDLGLAIASAHLPLPVGDQRGEVVDIAGSLGVTRVVSSTGRDAFGSADALAALCDTWNQAGEAVAANGLELGLHNHYWEFAEVGGRSGFDILIEELDPAIFFQVDTYWVQTGGADVNAVIGKLGARAPLIHIKDGPCTPEADMVAAGDGAMDFPSLLKVAGDIPDWLIVELDRCGTDMMEAVEKSCQYLVSQGLGESRG